MPELPTVGTYRVGLALYRWIGAIISLVLSIFAILAFRDGEYWPSAEFAAFGCIGLLLLFWPGRFTFTQESITEQNVFGTFRIQWSEVRRVEECNGALVFIGDDRQFGVPPPPSWSGRQSLDALNLMTNRMRELGLVPVRTRKALFRLNRNVRVR